ncbi:MAG: PEGA domain-containing protein [Chitinivibrionales bacterium]|nr:PEGA domain-containing protein [Chitinivibrionales bacterium]
MTLEPGKSKDISVTMISIFSTLRIWSEPEGAKVSLNGQDDGTTPYHNANLKPGDYQLKLRLNTYKDTTENITLVKNQAIEHFFKLKHTQSYFDSIKTADKARQWVRRIVFGGLSAVAWGGGIYLNSLAQKHIDNQKQIQADYRATTNGFSDYSAKYNAEGKSAANDVLFRNILYGAGGALMIGCLLSIPF